MGCQYYIIKIPLPWSSDRPNEPMDRETGIKFVDSDRESEYDHGCLCTFPHGKEELDRDTVIALAQLGAAVVLVRHGHLDDVCLPYDLPGWILEQLEQFVVGKEDQDAVVRQIDEEISGLKKTINDLELQLQRERFLAYPQP